MKSMQQLFSEAFVEAKQKGFDHIVVAVDLHGTIVDSKLYNRVKGSEEEKLAHSIYHKAIEALILMTEDPAIEMFIYSGTEPISLVRIKNSLKTCFDIDISLGYEASTTVEKQSFIKKPYFSVLLDNKAGFDPVDDWDAIIYYLKSRKP